MLNHRVSGRSPLSALALFAIGACATSTNIPDGPGESEARVFADGPGHRARSSAPADTRLPARRLDGPTGLIGLCDNLRDESAMTFAGNEVEQARARERHRSRRIEATASRYQIDVPSDGFAFGPYDLSEKRLLVASKTFPVGGGAEIYAVESAALTFAIGADAADRVLKLHDERTLTLRIVFRPAPSDMRNELCMRLGGGIAKLAVDVHAGYLVSAQGATLARYETQDFAQVMASVTPVGQATVEIDNVMAEDGGEIPAAVSATAQALAPAMLTCYKETLARSPNVRGKVVIRADLNKDGVLGGARMEVSSVGDNTLVTCALRHVNGARLAPATRPRAVFVPVNFGPRTE